MNATVGWLRKAERYWRKFVQITQPLFFRVYFCVPNKRSRKIDIAMQWEMSQKLGNVAYQINVAMKFFLEFDKGISLISMQ